jgi:leucyl/phenylalanyl-tRNA--protein transferase
MDAPFSQTGAGSGRSWQSPGDDRENGGEAILKNNSREVLTSDLLLSAYRQGIFPMAVDARGTIGWFSPDPRAIIPLDDRFHVPHGLRRTLRKQSFEVTIDRNFPAVIAACSKAHGETWISPEIIRSYTELHHLGNAHSVEVWQGGRLAGGLYGVQLGGAFFGESMFHHQTDASKVALVHLVQHLRRRGFTLLDTQWTTPHLERFGACEIPRAQYLRLLGEAIRLDGAFGAAGPSP